MKTLFRSILVLVCLCVGTAGPALAARAPNAVERTIVITGRAAADLADLFGLESGAAAKLRLGRFDAWAVYLLKQDVHPPIFNDNNGSPARYNVLAYVAKPTPRVTIAPFWLDLDTARPNPHPGARFSFASPSIGAAGGEEWARLVARLKKDRGWKGRGEVSFRREFESGDGTRLTLEVRPDKRNGGAGFGISILVRTRP